LNFFDRFLKNPQISNFMKIYLVGAELFPVDGWTDRQMDGQTDMMKLIVTFQSFVNAAKNDQ
jgi:hypothetical protein